MARAGHGKYAVVGLASFGTTVALELERLGNEVLGIDRDQARVDQLADRLSHAVVADVRDERTVEELDLADYDAVVVAIGEDLESNILCTLGLKSAGVRQVWVKAVTPSHHRILGKLGADRIVHPEHEMGVHVAQTLNYPYVLDYIPLGNDYYVVELEVTDAVAGAPVSELGLDDLDIRLVALKRARKPQYEPDDEPLEKGQRLVLIGALDDLRALGSKL